MVSVFLVDCLGQFLARWSNRPQHIQSPRSRRRWRSSRVNLPSRPRIDKDRENGAGGVLLGKGALGLFLPRHLGMLVLSEGWGLFGSARDGHGMWS